MGNPSSSLATPDHTQFLSLNCLVLGDKPNDAFTVEIPKTKNVSILKDLIKEKKAPDLDHVAASKLDLTQVSLAFDEELEENLKTVDLVPLTPLRSLLQVFPRVEENSLHIIVQAPSKGQFTSFVLHVAASMKSLEPSTTSDVKEEVRRDQIGGLHRSAYNFFLPSLFFTNTVVIGYKNLILNILDAVPPSDSAKSSNYPKSQLVYSIHDGRYKANKPRTSIAPPVQLYNPVFGHFLDDMRSDIAVPDDIVRQAAEYMISASAIYENEGERRAVLNPLLCRMLGVNIQMIVNADKTTPDGIVEHVQEGKNVRSLNCLQEDKNEYGDGNSDPATQSGLSVARCWAQSRVC